MRSITVRSCAAALALIAYAGAAFAHHPPRFERCQRFTFTGELERIDWSNPHVLLSIRTDDGARHQLGWLHVQGLALEGIEPDTLRVGDRLVVEGGVRPDDLTHEPILVSGIRRPGDGWEWSQPLQGC